MNLGRAGSIGRRRISRWVVPEAAASVAAKISRASFGGGGGGALRRSMK
jgi:hypothetical protein